MKHPLLKWVRKRPGNLIPVFFLSLTCTTTAQWTFPDSRQLALGDIRTVNESLNSFPSNPALLGYAEGHTFVAGHTRPFLLKELGVSHLGGSFEAEPGGFLWKLTGYGITGFSCITLETGFGMILGENLTAGISFHYTQFLTAGSAVNPWSLGPGGGIHYCASPRTTVALLLKNPFSMGNLYRGGPGTPSELAFGVSRMIYNKTLLICELTALSYQARRFKFGIIYTGFEQMTLRAGYHTFPPTLSTGAGLKYRGMLIDMAIGWSAVPGIHPGVMFTHQKIQ